MKCISKVNDSSIADLAAALFSTKDRTRSTNIPAWRARAFVERIRRRTDVARLQPADKSCKGGQEEGSWSRSKLTELIGSCSTNAGRQRYSPAYSHLERRPMYIIVISQILP